MNEHMRVHLQQNETGSRETLMVKNAVTMCVCMCVCVTAV